MINNNVEDASDGDDARQYTGDVKDVCIHISSQVSNLSLTGWEGKGALVRCRRCLLPKTKGISQTVTFTGRLINMKILVSKWELYQLYSLTIWELCSVCVHEKTMLVLLHPQS